MSDLPTDSFRMALVPHEMDMVYPGTSLKASTLEKILDILVNGHPNYPGRTIGLIRIFEEKLLDDLPTLRSFHYWMRRVPQIKAMVDAAREIQAEVDLDRAVDHIHDAEDRLELQKALALRSVAEWRATRVLPHQYALPQVQAKLAEAGHSASGEHRQRAIVVDAQDVTSGDDDAPAQAGDRVELTSGE